MSMGRCAEDVKAFHEKLDFVIGKDFETDFANPLWAIGNYLLEESKKMLETAKITEPQGDLRYTRAHLMLEELGELLVAMATGDEVQALDGCMDLLYVVVGLGVTYNWPMEDAWQAVVMSNLTKKRKSEEDIRCRDKGDEFRPADFKGLLLARDCEHSVRRPQ